MSDKLTCPICGHGRGGWEHVTRTCSCSGCDEMKPQWDAEAEAEAEQHRAAAAEQAARDAKWKADAEALPEAVELTEAVLVQRAHDELLAERFCWAVGFGWMRWTGQVWIEAPEEAVREVIRVWVWDSAKALNSNSYGLSGDTEKRILKTLGGYTIKLIAELSRGICQVDASVFDADPDLLNTPTGVVDLRTGELLPHDPTRYMTRITGVGYVPGEDHEDWTAALGAVPAEVADWLQVRFGQAITGHMTPDDVVLLLHGGGSNGKSTVLAGITDALGLSHGYATYVSDRVLLAKPDAHPTELTEFHGARLALTEELPDEGRLNAKRLKDIAGTPTMTARKIRQDSITWDSTHSMFLSTNYLPKVTETDTGTWRRLALVTFPYRFRKPGEPLEGPDDRPSDPGLRDRLDGEAQRAAVLRWLVAGAQRWYAAGKVMPDQPSEVVSATRAWREQSDLILRFWSECLIASPRHYVASPDMLAEFNAWAEAQGHRPRSIQQFNAQFGDHEMTKQAGVTFGYRHPKADHLRAFRPQRGAVLVNTASALPPPEAKKTRAWWGVRFASDQGE